MASLARTDVRSAESIIADLQTIRGGERFEPRTLLPRVGELLHAELVMTYGLHPQGDALSVEFLAASGFAAETYARDFDKVLLRQPVGWGAFNPLRPERRQRNVVKVVGPVVPQRLYDSNPDATPLIENHRFLLESQQLRVLVCDGPVMLAWVGAFRREPFGAREHGLLRRLVPALHERLRLERSLEVALVAAAGFETAMENVAGPAFLVRSPDRVVFANAGGRALLGRDADATRTVVAHAVRGARTRFDAHRIEGYAGLPPHWLVVERPAPRDPRPRVAHLARECALTPRQAEVLAHLATGKANKTIAAELGCAEVTVELHVTGVLAKLGCETRSQAVAKVWMD